MRCTSDHWVVISMVPGSGASLILVVDAQPTALWLSQRQPSSCPCGIAPHSWKQQQIIEKLYQSSQSSPPTGRLSWFTLCIVNRSGAHCSRKLPSHCVTSFSVFGRATCSCSIGKVYSAQVSQHCLTIVCEHFIRHLHCH